MTDRVTNKLQCSTNRQATWFLVLHKERFSNSVCTHFKNQVQIESYKLESVGYTSAYSSNQVNGLSSMTIAKKKMPGAIGRHV
jgi:hypothetical protein